MRRESIRDLLFTVSAGGIVGVVLVVFAGYLPPINIREPYLYIQFTIFSALVGALPVIAIHARTPQGILVPVALSVTGGLVSVRVLISDIDPVLKLVMGVSTLGSIVIVTVGIRLLPVAVFYLIILLAAGVVAFCIVIFLGLLSASTIPRFAWPTAMAAGIAFLVLFDSLSREIAAPHS